MTIWSDYETNPGDNNSPPPVGAPEGMPPSSVDDTMREMMSVIRQLGDQVQATFQGLGTMSTQNANAVAITGGAVNAVLSGPGTGITSLSAPNLQGIVPQANLNGYYPGVDVDGAINASNAATLGGFTTYDMLPIGAIIMFYGAAWSWNQTVWAFCDGTRGTPDLRNRFPMGAVGPDNLVPGGASNAVTDVQGSHSHFGATQPFTLTLNEMPSHDHGISGRSIVLDEPGGGGVSGGSAPINIIAAQYQGGGAAHAHGISNDGAHGHNVTIPNPPNFGVYFLMRVA